MKVTKTPVTPSLDDKVEGEIREETAQARAVSSLIEVKPKKEGELGTEIELKTDLSEREVCIHTAVDMMDFILSMKKTKFKSSMILGNLTTLKERKSLSKDRKSRAEIVDVARNPDMTMMGADQHNPGFVKRFVTSRKERNVNR